MPPAERRASLPGAAGEASARCAATQGRELEQPQMDGKVLETGPRSRSPASLAAAALFLHKRCRKVLLVRLLLHPLRDGGS